METEFKVGDYVEATWAGGKQTKHTIIRIEDSPHGSFYRFLDEEGFEVGLHGKYLRLISRPKE